MFRLRNGIRAETLTLAGVGQAKVGFRGCVAKTSGSTAVVAMVREAIAQLSKVARAVVLCNNGTKSSAATVPEAVWSRRTAYESP